MIRKGEYYSSRHAAYALARFGQAGIPALSEALKSTHYGVASHAASAIGTIKDPSATSDLMGLVNRGVEDAIGSLGLIGKGAEAAVPLLIRIVEQRKEHDDSTPSVDWGSPRRMVWKAAAALGEIKDTRAADCLISMLRDDDESNREIASKALEKMGVEQTAPGFEESQQDTDDSARNAVGRTLEWIRDKLKSHGVRS